MVLFLVLSASMLPLSAQTGRNIDTLGTLTITGLKRTQERVVRSIINVNEGSAITAEELDRIEQDLMKSGIFSSVALELDYQRETDSTDLIVRLTEKWTLIPVPYFASDGTSLSGGLFLIESNLLGFNTFLLSALYGGTDSGLRGLMVFNNPSLGGSSWSLSAVGGFGTTSVENRLADGTLIRAYDTEYLHTGIGLGYLWNSWFQTEAMVRVRSWQPSSFTAGVDTVALGDLLYAEPSLTMHYDRTRLSHVLLVGTAASASARVLVPHGGWELSGEVSWGIRTLSDHRLQLLASGGYGDMPTIAESSIDARDGYRTLPFQKTTADTWASGSVRYDIPLFHGSWGTPVLTPYWETGVFSTELIDRQVFYGPGIGFRVYLKQIALPAMGVDLAYNIPDAFWSFSITVGMPL